MDVLRSGERHVRLKPRRADAKLIDGVLTVTADGWPIVLEGKLAKSPSFWVKSVTVMKRYDRFGGIALPVTIESIADLRMFGQSSLRMGYRYSEVNGRTVSHTAAAMPSFGPSAEIMALHSAAARDQ